MPKLAEAVAVGCTVLLSAACSIPCQGGQTAEETGKSWRLLADIPIPQFGCATAVVNNKMHVLGGVTADHKASDAHQVYDPAKNSWSKKASLPDKSGWPAVAVFRGKIYLFGGDNRGIDIHRTDTAWVYDPATDAWSDLARLPGPRSYAAATTVGNYIYIFGNRTLRSETADRSTYRYDPAKNTYKRMADLPEGARFITQAHYNGSIYAVHGETDEETMADGVLQYDVAKDTWAKLNIPRIQKRKWTLSQHSANAAMGSRLFVLGGKPTVGPRTNTAAYFDMRKEQFVRVDPMPAGRCCAGAGVINGKIYVAGGFWVRTGDVSTCRQTWGYPFPKEKTPRTPEQ